MVDLLPNIVAVAQHAKCIPEIKTITHNIGVTYLTAFISTVVGMAVAGVLGYFIGKRGLLGTKTDIKNAETEVQKVVEEVKTVHP